MLITTKAIREIIRRQLFVHHYIIVAMQVSVVITVLNEAHSLPLLCHALAAQTKLPKEVLIVDGGSSDTSKEVLKHCQTQYPLLSLKVIHQTGNRSVGRNAGIQAASSDWIAITDSGCEPAPNWLAELCATQKQTQADVVAGYYQGLASTPLTEAIIPYVLVMPDQVNPTSFLPATRSMLLRKKVWHQLGGFDERFSHNEDYVFARRLKINNTTIAFAQNAIVLWHPRTTLWSFAHMIYRFAVGDAESKCYRPKVWLVFGRYALTILSLGIVMQLAGTGNTGLLAVCLFVLYSGWAIIKNYHYTKHGWYWLPVLQLLSDMMVMTGTVVGLSMQKSET